MKFSIRPALLIDLPILLDFEQGIVSAERPFDPSLAPDPIHYYDLKALIESNDSEVLVVEDSGEIIGGGYVTIKKAKPYLDHELYAYIGFMYVRPEYRGHGLAGRILDELTTWARYRNLNEIRLEVYDQNESAVTSYLKSGFSKNLVEMRKRI